MSQINTDPMSTVLSTDTPTHMQPSSMSENKTLDQEHHHALDTTTGYKNAFFCCNCLLQLLKHVILYGRAPGYLMAKLLRGL
jgi:hypothetical protein